MTRYLTKSKFKLACECPAKLFYVDKDEYANSQADDPFLASLADGGFQVGALAKQYFPGGIEVVAQGTSDALKETKTLLSKEKVTIFEAAISHNNLLIRPDIIEKVANKVNLIEVKAKSVSPKAIAEALFQSGIKLAPFVGKRGTILSAWLPYVFDIAYQKHVARLAHPSWKIKAFLMMPDKDSKCPSDGLNQKFMLEDTGKGRPSVRVSKSLTAADLTPQILCKINVDKICDIIFSTDQGRDIFGNSFAQSVKKYAAAYEKDLQIASPVSSACRTCQFKATEEDFANGLGSGYEECLTRELGWSKADFDDPSVFDIWNYHELPKLLEEGYYKIRDVPEEAIHHDDDQKPGLSASERRWMQIEKIKNNDDSIWIDHCGLSDEMMKWTYPLHFIDFETTRVAIPFNKGKRPYEQIAFQFSHHTVDSNGTIEHKTEYINVKSGVFPNFDFIRALKDALDKDNGTIFMYAPHENTVLNEIYLQIKAERPSLKDEDALCDFIRSITHYVSDDPKKAWIGPRAMVDMCHLVKRYYYDPATKGSNSIKAVLPAILNSSVFLQKKYGQPIYGASSGTSQSAGAIKSHNFKDFTWIEMDNGLCKDPYKLLPKISAGINTSAPSYRRFFSADAIADGGAALTAYGKLQFTSMSPHERTEVTNALLKYCELDTLAMVMLFEGWQDQLNKIASSPGGKGNSLPGGTTNPNSPCGFSKGNPRFFDFGVNSPYWLDQLKNHWGKVYNETFDFSSKFKRYFTVNPDALTDCLDELPYLGITPKGFLKITRAISRPAYGGNNNYPGSENEKEDSGRRRELDDDDPFLEPPVIGNLPGEGRPIEGRAAGRAGAGLNSQNVIIDCYGLYVSSLFSWLHVIVKSGKTIPPVMKNMHNWFSRYPYCDGPAVLIAADYMDGISKRLKADKSVKDNSPEDAFAMTFYHEVGHHIFQDHNGSLAIGEGYANWFAYQCLPPSTRTSLWSKTRHQSEAYRMFEGLLQMQFALEDEAPWLFAASGQINDPTSELVDVSMSGQFSSRKGTWADWKKAIEALGQLTGAKTSGSGGKPFEYGVTNAFFRCLYLWGHMVEAGVYNHILQIAEDVLSDELQYCRANKKPISTLESTMWDGRLGDLASEINTYVKDPQEGHKKQYIKWCRS